MLKHIHKVTRIGNVTVPQVVMLTLAILVVAVIGGGTVAAAPEASRPTPPPDAPDLITILPDGSVARVGNPTAIFQSGEAGNSTQQANVAFVLDASGSMNAVLPGTNRTKLAVAKEVLTELLSEVPAEVNTALWVYGHRYSQASQARSCQDIERVLPLGPPDTTAYTERIQRLGAIGYTPIADSLQAAARDFPIGEDQFNTIVLISDGEETCGGDPCAVARALAGNDAAITFHTINFDAGEATRQQLLCIANASGGTYRDAGDEAGLATAVDDALKAAKNETTLRVDIVDVEGQPIDPSQMSSYPVTSPFFHVYDSATRQYVTSYAIGIDNVVPPGIYDIIVDTTPQLVYQQVALPAGQTTIITVALGTLTVDLKAPSGLAPIRPRLTIVDDATGLEIGQSDAASTAEPFSLIPGIYQLTDSLSATTQKVAIEAGRNTHVSVGVPAPEPTQQRQQPKPTPSEAPVANRPQMDEEPVDQASPTSSDTQGSSFFRPSDKFGGALSALIVGLVVTLAITVMFYGLLRYVADQVITPEDRIYYELARRHGEIPLIEEDRPFFLIDFLNRFIEDRDFTDNLARELLQADLRLTVSEYLLIRTALVLGSCLLGILLTGNPIPGIALGIVAYFIPPAYVRRRKQKRIEAFNDQLEDVLTLLVGSLRAGYGLLQALNVVVDEIPSPAADEFRRVIREVGLGLSLQEALDNLVHRIQSEDLDMLVTAINIQQEVGGNLADILDTISETIRERVRILGEIRVLTSQQRLTGLILALLPVFLGAAIFVLNPEYISELFKPGPILLIPGLSVVLEIIGYFVIQKIVDIKV